MYYGDSWIFLPQRKIPCKRKWFNGPNLEPSTYWCYHLITFGDIWLMFASTGSKYTTLIVLFISHYEKNSATQRKIVSKGNVFTEQTYSLQYYDAIAQHLVIFCLMFASTGSIYTTLIVLFLSHNEKTLLYKRFFQKDMV